MSDRQPEFDGDPDVAQHWALDPTISARAERSSSSSTAPMEMTDDRHKSRSVFLSLLVLASSMVRYPAYFDFHGDIALRTEFFCGARGHKNFKDKVRYTI